MINGLGSKGLLFAFFDQSLRLPRLHSYRKKGIVKTPRKYSDLYMWHFKLIVAWIEDQGDPEARDRMVYESLPIPINTVAEPRS